MSQGIVDTTVILHYFRLKPETLTWIDSLTFPLSVTSITWLEVMSGATSKANQAESRRILEKFERLYLNSYDQQWAIEQLDHFQFSHHITMNDCLIASVAHRLQIPLYTHNLKDMTPLIGELAVMPYP